MSINGGAPFHPLIDDGAVDCSYGQSGQVWFLGGTYVSNPDPQTGDYVGNASRSCTIPAGTALFFPILNAEADTLGPDGKPTDVTIDELWQWVNTQMDLATDLEAQIDGRTIANLTRYRVTSPAFAITMPQNNLYQYFGYPVAPGTYSPAVADGIFLMLAPLPVGQHTISFQGASPGFKLNVTYDITVTPHK
jgi:hypothetical protein